MSELNLYSGGCYDVSYPAFLNSPRRCVAGLPRRGFGTAAHCFASIIIVGQEMLRAKQVGQVLRALVDFTTKHQVFEAGCAHAAGPPGSGWERWRCLARCPSWGGGKKRVVRSLGFEERNPEVNLRSRGAAQGPECQSVPIGFSPSSLGVLGLIPAPHLLCAPAWNPICRRRWCWRET